MFAGLNPCLVDASELEFPVLYNTETNDIYTTGNIDHPIVLSNMFVGCNKLTKAPTEIPYIQSNVATPFYTNMFSGCTSLTVSPLIYMCKDYGNSFENMFASCPLTKLMFRTNGVVDSGTNEIGNLFGSNGLASANSSLTIYKLPNVTYNNSTSNFGGFCGHTGSITVKNILSDRESFSGTYQHYKY